MVQGRISEFREEIVQPRQQQQQWPYDGASANRELAGVACLGAGGQQEIASACRVTGGGDFYTVMMEKKDLDFFLSLSGNSHLSGCCNSRCQELCEAKHRNDKDAHVCIHDGNKNGLNCESDGCPICDPPEDECWEFDRCDSKAGCQYRQKDDCESCSNCGPPINKCWEFDSCDSKVGCQYVKKKEYEGFRCFADGTIVEIDDGEDNKGGAGAGAGAGGNQKDAGGGGGAGSVGGGNDGKADNKQYNPETFAPGEDEDDEDEDEDDGAGTTPKTTTVEVKETDAEKDDEKEEEVAAKVDEKKEEEEAKVDEKKEEPAAKVDDEKKEEPAAKEAAAKGGPGGAAKSVAGDTASTIISTIVSAFKSPP